MAEEIEVFHSDREKGRNELFYQKVQLSLGVCTEGIFSYISTRRKLLLKERRGSRGKSFSFQQTYETDGERICKDNFLLPKFYLDFLL